MAQFPKFPCKGIAHVLNALDIILFEYFTISPLSPLTAKHHLSKLSYDAWYSSRFWKKKMLDISGSYFPAGINASHLQVGFCMLFLKSKISSNLRNSWKCCPLQLASLYPLFPFSLARPNLGETQIRWLLPKAWKSSLWALSEVVKMVLKIKSVTDHGCRLWLDRLGLFSGSILLWCLAYFAGCEYSSTQRGHKW